MRKIALLSAGLAATAGCAENAPSTNGQEQLGAVSQLLDTWAEERNFNGVIIAGEAGAPIFLRAEGVADPATGRQLNTTTRFQTGSVDKYFSAIAVFALADAEQLDIDAPLSRYLPDYRSDTGAILTLRHLLTNGSGLPNDIRQAFRRASNGEREVIDAMDVPAAIADFASGDLQFEPGEQFDYVLSNWLLVHHVLERVTDMTYGEVLQAYVFGPAGMSESGSYTHDLTETRPVTENVAIGFDPNDPDGRGDYWSPRFFEGSFTTAGDLLKLSQALEDGHLMQPDSLRLFRTVQFPETSYAFGGRFDEWEVCGETRAVSRQSGSNGATNITFVYDFTSGYGVSALTNVDESQGEMFALSHTVLETLEGCR